jgi:hypothetical protein
MPLLPVTRIISGGAEAEQRPRRQLVQAARGGGCRLASSTRGGGQRCCHPVAPQMKLTLDCC